MAEFRTAIRLNPNDAGLLADAHFNLGKALYEKGDVDGAMVEYRAALGINPNHFNAHNYLGTALYKKGDLDGGIAEFRAALLIKPNPNAASSHLALGAALELKGQLDEALDEYRSAMTLDPRLWMAKARYEDLAVKLHKK